MEKRGPGAATPASSRLGGRLLAGGNTTRKAVGGAAMVCSAPTAEGLEEGAEADVGRRIGLKQSDGPYVITALMRRAGGVGWRMYRADTASGQSVVVKAVSMKANENRAEQQQLARKGRVLQSLNYPSIPKFVACFTEIDWNGAQTFYLAQRACGGESLTELVRKGKRLSESDVVDIAVEVLQVLSYLEQVQPAAVVHGNISPSSIMVDEERARENDAWAGHVKVVGFRAFPTASASNDKEFMAPEQPRAAKKDRPDTRSDLYAVGATMLYLLSGRLPSTLKGEFGGEADLRCLKEVVQTSDYLVKVLQVLLQDAPDGRFRTANDVILALRWRGIDPRTASVLPGKSGKPPAHMGRKPEGCRVCLTSDGREMTIEIPPRAGRDAECALSFFCISMTITVMVGPLVLLRSMSALWFLILLLGAVLGCGISWPCIWQTPEVSTRVNIIAGGEYTIEDRLRSLVGWRRTFVKGRVADFVEVTRVIGHQKVENELLDIAAACEVVEVGNKRHRFAREVNPSGNEWLIKEINGFIYGSRAAEDLRTLV